MKLIVLALIFQFVIISFMSCRKYSYIFNVLIISSGNISCLSLIGFNNFIDMTETVCVSHQCMTDKI